MDNSWVVHAAGSMPFGMRSAAGQGHTGQKVLLVAELPAGTQDITPLEHCQGFRQQKAA